MRRARALLLACLTLLGVAGAVRAETVFVEPSTRVVNITSNFTGETVTLFGVIGRDAQTVSRRGGYDVVITLAGPVHRLLVQRKERIGPLWLNASSERFTEVPSYYAVFSNRPVTEIAYGTLARELGLGLHYVGHGGEVRGVRAAREPFREALVRLRQDAALYLEDAQGVTFVTADFFRADFPLPSSVEDGTYVARVHLFAAGTLLAVTETTVRLDKVGFEQAIFALATERPLLYGLAVVALALFVGYVGGVVFRRG